MVLEFQVLERNREEKGGNYLKVYIFPEMRNGVLERLAPTDDHLHRGGPSG